MALKLELKPNERVLLGDCVLTNSGQRTRLTIDGSLPILREKDIMSLRQADSPAKCIYLAVQFMYLAKDPKDNHALYVRLAREMAKAAPGAKPLVNRINDHISAGDFYKALKEARKLIAYENEHPEDASCRQGRGKIQRGNRKPARTRGGSAVESGDKTEGYSGLWSGKKPKGLDDALLYNRRLWAIFIDAVTKDGNKLPKQVRENSRCARHAGYEGHGAFDDSAAARGPDDADRHQSWHRCGAARQEIVQAIVLFGDVLQEQHIHGPLGSDSTGVAAYASKLIDELLDPALASRVAAVPVVWSA